MGVIDTVGVILLDDLIKELVETGIRVVRSSVKTNSRVLVLNSREDLCLEGDTSLVHFILILVPDLLSQTFGEKGVGSWLEERVKVAELISSVWLSLHQKIR
jgi:hypothetical protein